MTVSAGAQTVPYSFWSGAAVFDKTTAACNNNGNIAAGDIAFSDYRALQGIDGEPTHPGITFMFARSGHAFFETGGTADPNTMNGNGSYNAYLIRGSVTTIPNPSSGTYPGTFKFKVKPTTITSTTDSITIDGQITNWRNIAGCTVTFRAAYRLAPQ
jgi:hypothetical protein